MSEYTHASARAVEDLRPEPVAYNQMAWFHRACDWEPFLASEYSSFVATLIDGRRPTCPKCLVLIDEVLSLTEIP